MSGKSVTFLVNDYDNSGGSTSGTIAAPISYFILGAAKDDTADPVKALRGDELVEGLCFKDDLRDTTNPDKVYHREDGTDGVYVASDTVRADLTAELLTRGGWRDHTDGNRISTTRGDCVEVVYGNYKLVVLGRIASAFDPTANGGLGDAGNDAVNTTLAHTSFDASGGHITEATSAEGKVVSCVWSADDEDGSWETLEQTDLGDKKTHYTGYYESAFFGSEIKRKIGQGTSEETIDNGANTAIAHAADKPDITDKTFARSIVHSETIATRTEDISVTGDAKTQRDVETKSLVARDYDKYGELVAAVAFREELMAQTITTRSDYSGWRFNIEAGIAGCRVLTLPYHETLYRGSHMRTWFGGASFDYLVGLSTALRVGMDNAYGTGPWIDENTGPQIVLRSSVDVVLGMYRASCWMKRHKMGLLVGGLAVAATVVSAVSLQS